jgi:hypothetical protein
MSQDVALTTVSPATAAVSAQSPPISVDEAFNDAIHILPLTTIPLSVRGLQRWSLIKNARLETMLEVYRLEKGGGGHVQISEVGEYFSDHTGLMKDIPILRQLSTLRSYDVFTLRAQLRRLGVPVTSWERLRLSDARKFELLEFMQEFTRPLMQKVYGGETKAIAEFVDLVRLFSQPNNEEALRNLRMLADHLEVGLKDIPGFIEDYGDVFLSMAYFRAIFGAVLPVLVDFKSWTREIMQSYALRDDEHFQRSCEGMLDTLGNLAHAIASSFAEFERSAKVFWDDITMASFHSLRSGVTRQHTTVGGLLCGLFVKTNAWRARFAGKRAQPTIGAEFIRTEMIPGLQTMRESLRPENWRKP